MIHVHLTPTVVSFGVDVCNRFASLCVEPLPDECLDSSVMSDCHSCKSQDHVFSMINHVAPVKANQPPPVGIAGCALRSTNQWDLTDVINNQEVQAPDVNSSPGSFASTSNASFSPEIPLLTRNPSVWS